MIERCATEVFAERGYRGASMSEIARRAGVTVPVLYDHFDSKIDLHRRLLERTRNELLEVWREHLGGERAGERSRPAGDRGLGGLCRGQPVRRADVLPGGLR